MRSGAYRWTAQNLGGRDTTNIECTTAEDVEFTVQYHYCDGDAYIMYSGRHGPITCIPLTICAKLQLFAGQSGTVDCDISLILCKLHPRFSALRLQ